MPRSRSQILLFALLFLTCVLGSWAWFNTDIGRSDSQPRLWLTAWTNIEGYTFIPEPVSENVMKTLGTTNILSGTFFRTANRKLIA